MSRIPVTTLIILLMITVCTPLLAQDGIPEEEPLPGEPTRSFSLLRDSSSAADELDIEDEELDIWEPAIVAGTVELSFGFGFIDFGKELWENDQIIYKYTADATSWGDVAIKGESAFNPVLRLGYNFTKWLSIEAVGGVAFTEYTSTITNRRAQDNKPGSPIVNNPPLGEYDAENRSLMTMQASLNLVLYPLNIGGDGKGKMQPYLTGGFGGMWYEMNSNYFSGTASTTDFSGGLGLRVLADKNISIRFEILGHFNELQFTPSRYFAIIDEGTIVVPLTEYPRNADGSVNEQIVTEYSSKSLTLINWNIGVQGSF